MYKLGPTSLLTNQTECIFKINEDGSGLCIPLNPANTDYQEYLEWIAEGNTPEPANTITDNGGGE
jgi:hypothetical protein